MTTRDARRGKAHKQKTRWTDAPEGEVHSHVFDYVARVERAQFDIYNRFVCLEELYDPNTPNSPGAPSLEDDEDPTSLVIENVVASIVDTVAAAIAATEVRPRYMTDDGDWTTQQTAKRLEWYSEGLGTLLDVDRKCRIAFREAAKKGTGIVKVHADGDTDLGVAVTHVRIDDIVVDEAECRSGGRPRQLHQRMVNVDREELVARFPDYEDEIYSAQTGRGWSRFWAGYRPIVGDTLVVIESWKLPIGRRGRPGYRPGRHAITIDGCDLLDEEWHKTDFPFAVIVWSERTAAFFGISLAERVSYIQRALNKRNWQIDLHIDQYAIPTTYVDMQDAKLAVTRIDRAGSIVVCKGERPKTVTPTAVSPEVFTHRELLKASAYQDSGVNTMAAHGTKPGGLESGRALMEYRDQTTQRFAIQEKAFEHFVLDVFVLIVDVCKDLGKEAPVISRKAKFGARKIKWADVDMRDVRVQIAAASTLSRTPAGRYQIALDWVNAGVISTDEWRKISDHPDLDRILSAYTQGAESVERDLEAIREGFSVTPDPAGNLLLMVRNGQMAYLHDRDLGAPEEVLEGLQDYFTLAAYMHKRSAAANQNATPGDPALGAPPAAQPVAALAPQAMDLMAS
jgi:hypothetical protein